MGAEKWVCAYTSGRPVFLVTVELLMKSENESASERLAVGKDAMRDTAHYTTLHYIRFFNVA